jgi:AAA+ ATPase superfamily predicted ATPase
LSRILVPRIRGAGLWADDCNHRTVGGISEEDTNMRRIEFHNRVRELKEITKILDVEPSLITFVYGPMNSGKTTLVSHLIEGLPEEYVVFYINLRGRFISDYRDFIRVLFKIERGKNYKEVLRTISEISAETLKFSGIPVAESVMNALFKEKSYPGC